MRCDGCGAPPRMDGSCDYCGRPATRKVAPTSNYTQITSRGRPATREVAPIHPVASIPHTVAIRDGVSNMSPGELREYLHKHPEFAIRYDWR